MRSQLLFILLITLMASSCRVIRENKIRKSVGVVLGDETAREFVYTVVSGLHPILPVEPVYIKGKDSIIRITEPIYYKETDSFFKIEYPKLNLDSLRKANIITIYKSNTDTIRVSDNNMQRLYENERANVITLKTEVAQQSNAINAIKKTRNKYLLFIISLSLGLLAALGMLFMSLKRNKRI